MKLDPLPPEALAHLDPLERSIYDLTEKALRELAAEPGEVGDYIRAHRPDLKGPGEEVRRLRPDLAAGEPG